MKRVPLAEIAAINPRLPEGVDLDPNRLVSFIPMAAVSESGCVTKAVDRRLGEVAKGYSSFRNGDVLLAKITPCFENGKAALVDQLPHDIGFGSTEFHVLRPSPAVEARYLFYALWNPAFRQIGERNMTGTAGQKRVPAALLQRYAIPLPGLGEQQRIAAILDKADAIRRKRREAIGLLGQLPLSAFIHRFGDWRRRGQEWPNVTVGDVADVQGGLQVTTKRFGLPIESPYLRVANVYRDKLDLGQVKTIRVSPGELERTRLEKGDVLVVEGHGNAEEIGRAAVWDGSVEVCTHQNHLIRLRPRPDVATSAFICGCLNAPEGRVQMARFGKTTSGLNTISTSNVRAVRIPLPPIELQERYGEGRRRVADLGGKLALAAEQADRLFASLSAGFFAQREDG